MHKIIAKISLVLVSLLIIYISFIWNTPRMSDAQLDINEATIFDTIVIMSAVLSIIVTILVGIGNALEKGNWVWAIGIFIFWPISYISLIF